MPLLCPSCCDCPAPQFAFVQRAVSKAKCGFRAFDGSPVWYLTSNDFDDATYCAGVDDCLAVTQVTQYDPATCVMTCLSGCDCTPDNDAGVGTCVTTQTATQYGIICSTATAGPRCGDARFGMTSSGSFLITLSNEYTTAMLQAIVVAALPAWGALSALAAVILRKSPARN